MSGKVFFVLLSFLFIFSLRSSAGNDPVQKIWAEYERANRLYVVEPGSSAIDSASLQGVQKVLDALLMIPRKPRTDSLIFQTCTRLGILYEVYKDYPRATAIYHCAFLHTQVPAEKFRMQVFLGAGYYNRNNFDSASYFLLQAADLPETLGLPEDRVRLFNTLGVLYYD